VQWSRHRKNEFDNETDAVTLSSSDESWCFSVSADNWATWKCRIIKTAWLSQFRWPGAWLNANGCFSYLNKLDGFFSFEPQISRSSSFTSGYKHPITSMILFHIFILNNSVLMLEVVNRILYIMSRTFWQEWKTFHVYDLFELTFSWGTGRGVIASQNPCPYIFRRCRRYRDLFNLPFCMDYWLLVRLRSISNRIWCSNNVRSCSLAQTIVLTYFNVWIESHQNSLSLIGKFIPTVLFREWQDNKTEDCTWWEESWSRFFLESKSNIPVMAAMTDMVRSDSAVMLSLSYPIFMK
jgi:hypothetical protein